MLTFSMFYAFLLHYLQIEKKILTFVRLSIFLFAFEFLFRSALIGYLYVANLEIEAAGIVKIYSRIEEILNAVYCVFIFIKSFQVMFKEEKLFSYVAQFDNLKWIKTFLFLGIVIVFFWIFAIVLSIYYNNQNFYLPLRFFTSVLLYWIGYQGYIRLKFVKDRISLRNDLTKVNDQKEFHTTEKQKNDFEKVDFFIKSKKRYLDPNFNLESLADDLDVSVSFLSPLINKHSGNNFSDYINRFRVNQVKKLLTNHNYNHYDIVSIGLECGFNSKSAFYSSFKKFTNQTPKDYKNNFIK